MTRSGDMGSRRSRRPVRAKKVRQAAKQQPAARDKGGKEIKSSKLDDINLDPVAGMPTFDFESTADSDPREGSKPAAKD